MEELVKFQQEKEQIEKKIKIAGLAAVIGVALAVLLSQYFYIGGAIALPALIVLVIQSGRFKKLSRRFKLEVLVDVIASFVEDGKFDPDYGLDIRKVYATEFLKRADRYHTEDYLSGKIAGVQFESSDVKLEEKHVRHTKNGTQTTWETYFMGRVFIFEFNKSFDGYLQVLESGRPTVNRKYNKVKMESVKFNKKFKTFSTSDHSAFYVLTPHFMEALMEFEKNNKGVIRFSFIDNLLYIGIDNRKDTFELKMFRKLDEHSFDEFKKELFVVKEVVEELKLNNSIFKK